MSPRRAGRQAEEGPVFQGFGRHRRRDHERTRSVSSRAPVASRSRRAESAASDAGASLSDRARLSRPLVRPASAVLGTASSVRLLQAESSPGVSTAGRGPRRGRRTRGRCRGRRSASAARLRRSPTRPAFAERRLIGSGSPGSVPSSGTSSSRASASPPTTVGRIVSRRAARPRPSMSPSSAAEDHVRHGCARSPPVAGEWRALMTRGCGRPASVESRLIRSASSTDRRCPSDVRGLRARLLLRALRARPPSAMRAVERRTILVDPEMRRSDCQHFLASSLGETASRVLDQLSSQRVGDRRSGLRSRSLTDSRRTAEVPNELRRTHHPATVGGVTIGDASLPERLPPGRDWLRSPGGIPDRGRLRTRFGICVSSTSRVDAV